MSIKRVIDLLASGLGLVVAAPIILGAGILVRVTSPGPTFYAAERVGRYEKPFRMYKLRSMKVDADRTGGFQTHAGDSRITPVGKVLRKTSVDELPQLWNVLRGDMSLVGPRPAHHRQREQFTAGQWRRRCSIRPGVTGLAQVLVRSSGVVGEKQKYDLYYVRHCGTLLDLWIILKTVQRVLGGSRTN